MRVLDTMGVKLAWLIWRCTKDVHLFYSDLECGLESLSSLPSILTLGASLRHLSSLITLAASLSPLSSHPF